MEQADVARVLRDAVPGQMLRATFKPAPTGCVDVLTRIAVMALVTLINDTHALETSSEYWVLEQKALARDVDSTEWDKLRTLDVKVRSKIKVSDDFIKHLAQGLEKFELINLTLCRFAAH